MSTLIKPTRPESRPMRERRRPNPAAPVARSMADVAPVPTVLDSRRPDSSRGRAGILIGLSMVIMLSAGFAWWAKGKGVATRVRQVLTGGPAVVLAQPSLYSCRPIDGEAAVLPTTEVSAKLLVPNGKLDPRTLTPATARLVRDGDAAPIAATVRLGADGKSILLKPAEPLASYARYTFHVEGLKDAAGAAFVPFKSSFTTAAQADASVRFEKVNLPATAGVGFTAVQFGPDGRLWAGADDGRIFRFTVEPDGALAAPEIMDALRKANGGPRLLTGFCFDPASSPDQPVIWASHGWYGFNNAPDWSGKITRLSGSQLSVVQDVVVNLPRSVRDHLTNQPSFGPDGALYIPQASNSAFGDADADWGDRPEHLLNAAILRLDVAKLAPGRTLDVRTIDGGGSYDPSSADAPLTLYAHGVRLAYDLVWHSNGRLYVPTNGSSAGGNAPAGRGAPALKAIPDSEHDWLFCITPGKYYGHPNPRQGHFVLNGGNPTAGEDFAEVTQYPVGTRPDPDWRPALYDFGNHVSPNGAIEYRSGLFGGKLRGKLLVCRYNIGSDVIAIGFDEKGSVASVETGLAGCGNLSNPLDLTEDPRTGGLYVSEYGRQCITLLRPIDPTRNAR